MPPVGAEPAVQQRYSPVAVAGLVHRQSVPTVIRRTFVLTKTYTPRVDIADVPLVDPENSKKEWGRETLAGGSGYHFRVTGFDFDGNVILQGGQAGMTYLLGRDMDGGFDLVDVPPELPQPSYVGYTNVSGWQKQIFPKGCWLATMSVLAGRSQKDIQEGLGWPNESFYGISAKDLVEFSQMVECQVVKVPKDDIGAMYASVNHGAPVILGIQDPAHVMLIYAISTDPGHRMMRIWDPADAKIQEVETERVLKKADAIFLRQ